MILVTGANGFIDRRLLGGDTRALVRKRSGFQNEMVGDLLDSASLAQACEGIATVVHCAGYAHAASLSDAALHWRINYEGTRNLLTASGEAGVKRFVSLSSAKVMNLQRMAAAIRVGWRPPARDREQTIPGTRRLRSHSHSNGTGATRSTWQNLYRCRSSRLLRARNPGCDPNRLAKASPARVCAGIRIAGGGVLADWLEAAVKCAMPMNYAAVARLLDSECYASRLIEQELGWRASIGLVEGLREMLHE